MQVIDNYMDLRPAGKAALNKVLETFPCMIEVNRSAGKLSEVCITCYDKDAASIERIISPFV